MIRAIIGTVAVLAGFAVVESSVDASTGVPGSCKASDTYVMLRPGEPLAVHAAPTPGAIVVGVLAAQDSQRQPVLSVVTLTGSRSGWARIALNSEDYTAVDGSPARYGWIPADMLLVSTRAGTATTVRDNPGLLGSTLGHIDGGQTFRVLGCSGELLHVINAQQGNVWIDRWSAKAAS